MSKKKHCNFTQRVKEIKRYYNKALSTRNIIGMKNFENELTNVIKQWSLRNEKIPNENAKIIQDQLKDEASLLLDEMRETIKNMEIDMEYEFNDPSVQIETVNNYHEKYMIEIDKLFEVYQKYANINDVASTKKIIDHLQENFDKWDNIVKAFPSLKPQRYEAMHTLYVEIRTKFKTEHPDFEEPTEETVVETKDVTETTEETFTDVTDIDDSSESENQDNIDQFKEDINMVTESNNALYKDLLDKYLEEYENIINNNNNEDVIITKYNEIKKIFKSWKGHIGENNPIPEIFSTLEKRFTNIAEKAKNKFHHTKNTEQKESVTEKTETVIENNDESFFNFKKYLNIKNIAISAAVVLGCLCLYKTIRSA